MSRKLKYHENRYRNFIYENTTKASQYEQVAEEAVELAHVAQKIARILRGEQPVAEGVTFDSEFEKFIEEYADVELAVFITETIGGGHYDVDKKFLDIYDEKLIRWSERVKEKIGNGIEEYEEEIHRSIYSDEETEEKTEVKEDECNS